MKTFYQFLEALSSHGGFTMPHGGVFKPTLNKKDTEYISGMYKRPLVISSRGKLRGGIIAVLEAVLARVKNFNFHIYFGDIDSNYPEYFFEKNKIPRKDIVFVKNSSQGDLLTPWMILHNMGHAVFEMFEFETGDDSSVNEISDTVNNLINNLTFDGKTPFINVYTNNGDDLSFKPKEILSLLFNFASVKSTVEDKAVQDQEELAYEIFVYYLYGGGKLKRPDFKKLTKFCNQKLYLIKHTENYVEKLVNIAFYKIENQIRKVLELCRGKVIED